MSAIVITDPEDPHTKRIINFLTKITIEAIEPQKFVVHYPREAVFYHEKFRMKLIEFLLWHWFMSLEESKAKAEAKGPIKYAS